MKEIKYSITEEQSKSFAPFYLENSPYIKPDNWELENRTTNTKSVEYILYEGKNILGFCTFAIQKDRLVNLVTLKSHDIEPIKNKVQKDLGIKLI